MKIAPKVQKKLKAALAKLRLTDEPYVLFPYEDCCLFVEPPGVLDQMEALALAHMAHSNIAAVEFEANGDAIIAVVNPKQWGERHVLLWYWPKSEHEGKIKLARLSQLEGMRWKNP
jgi:hypothetical protein